MKKERLKEIITNISNMNKRELVEYSKKVYFSQTDIEEKAFKFIQKALDIQEQNLSEEEYINPLIVFSELREGEA